MEIGKYPNNTKRKNLKILVLPVYVYIFKDFILNYIDIQNIENMSTIYLDILILFISFMKISIIYLDILTLFTYFHFWKYWYSLYIYLQRFHVKLHGHPKYREYIYNISWLFNLVYLLSFLYLHFFSIFI